MQPIQTARLSLRLLKVADGEATFKFFGNPEVIRSILKCVYTSRKLSDEFILTNMHRKEYSAYSIWAVIAQSSGDLIGM